MRNLVSNITQINVHNRTGIVGIPMKRWSSLQTKESFSLPLLRLYFEALTVVRLGLQTL